FQAEDGIRDFHVTGVQTCALPIFFSTLMDSIRATGASPCGGAICVSGTAFAAGDTGTSLPGSNSTAVSPAAARTPAPAAQGSQRRPEPDLPPLVNCASASRIARINSSAEAKRSCGFFARARSITRSMALGKVGFSADGRSGVALMIL